MKKLYVGIDLAITGRHRASVYDPQENRYLDNSFAFDIDFDGFEQNIEQPCTPEREKILLDTVEMLCHCPTPWLVAHRDGLERRLPHLKAIRDHHLGWHPVH